MGENDEITACFLAVI